MDYARLRDQTLGSEQEEEAVTVNTRALIDKVLARYSGEWTTFRELIQNAADASASRVSIKFETLPSATVPTPQSTGPSDRLKHVVLHHTLSRVLVTNNGQPFNENDWSRLKRIAEGNPDETKIGAFGVGFYSVFADCENPFVTSGQQTMAFYWKGNSLFTRRGKLPTDQKNSDTCFVLDYRNTTSPVPNLISICHFLSTSLTFVGLEKIDLVLDDWNLFTLAKKAAPSTPVPIPRDLDTRKGMMRISSVESQNSQIDASWMNIVGWTPTSTGKSSADTSEETETGQSLRSFFSRLAGTTQKKAAAKKAAKEEEERQRAISEDLVGRSSATVFTRVNTIEIKTNVSSSFSAELERATKKPPPKQTRISILTSSFDETSATMGTLTGTAAQKAAEIITSILPSRSGRIFIGFPTAQTTGLLAHISAPSLIPTVERESIDLNARWVREWNSDLLGVAGIACRIAYAGEMVVLRAKLSSTSKAAGSIEAKEADVSALYPAAIHALKQYTFQESTPLPRAGALIEHAFWSCSKKSSIEIFSSRGVMQSQDVRLASEDLSFVSGIPVIPDPLLKDANDFISKLQEFGFINDITTSDIKSELEKKALSEQQLIELLKWAAHKVKINELDSRAVQSLFGVTIANVVGDGSSQADVLVLSQIKNFLNISKIGPENPVPPETIPFRLSKDIRQVDMQGFGWEELQVVPWLRWLLDHTGTKALSVERDMTISPTFAGQVLAVLSKNWDHVSQSSRGTIVELLSVRTVIPTKVGLKRPPEAYFSSVKLFDDLPTIEGLPLVKDKFLKALGVRKTIELHVIFERLMTKTAIDNKSQNSGWSHMDLMRYLVSVWSDIPEEDIAQLKAMPIWPAEKDGDSRQCSSQRYRMSELFMPRDNLRGLGLPILQWPGMFNEYNADGKFVRHLGLRSHPDVPELINVLVRANANKESALYEKALRYFIESHYSNNYTSFDMTGIGIPFLPLENGEPFQVVKPSDCFSDPKAEVLLYPILRKDLQTHATKFGVLPDPPAADCAARLIKRPPQSRGEARKVFGYLSGRAADINGTIASRLSQANIVPLTSRSLGKSEKESPVRLVPPSACFLGDGEEFGDIFDYVDFGQDANVFLLKVGCKHEPSTVEVARLVIRDPKRIYSTLGHDRYQGLLRRLHNNISTLKLDRSLWREMQQAQFLTAYKEEPPKNSEKNSITELGKEVDFAEEELEPRLISWRLKSADQITVADDQVGFNYFRDHLIVAPPDDTLESLCLALGSLPLSSLIEDTFRFGPRMSDQKEAENLRETILERARLFLHEQPIASIKHDAKWLEKNLEVELLQTISLRKSLRGRNIHVTERRSAAAAGKSKLCITKGPDSWQISYAIVGLLIERPKTQTLFMFETFLTTPLLKLRARGYNVDRILRKHAAQDRVAAEKQRQLQEAKARQQEEERARADEVDRNRPRPVQLPITAREPDSMGMGESSHSPDQSLMPGAFQDSPDRAIGNGRATEPGTGGFFSSLTRSLGLDNSRAQDNTRHQAIDNPLAPSIPAGLQNAFATRNPLAPPPYTQYDPQQVRGQVHTERVTPPDQVRQNLSRAVGASRPHGSSSLFSRPETNAVKETSSYCDTKPGHNLNLVGTTSAGLRVFAASGAMSPSFLSDNQAGLDAFSTIILACASIFNMPKESLHIYYDNSGNTIAFNAQGSIFCNYRFFAQLHLRGMMLHDHAQLSHARTQALVYWWVTLCHELAHNLVSDHSAQHSYYTEQFVAQYFPAVVSLAAGRNESG